MKFSTLRVGILDLLRRGTLRVGELGAKVPWGRLTLDRELKLLESSGHVRREADVVELTDQGRDLVAMSPWRCGYCGVSVVRPLGEGRWRAPKLSRKPCRSCKTEHMACRKCSWKAVVVEGEFPGYRPVLRACPPPLK